jgi:TonB-dependent Receptor Plug Domain
VSVLAGTACAQEPEAPQRVEIVGSHIPRIDVETAVPVQIITREEIARSGVASVEELLDRVSANVGGQHEAMGLGNADTPGFAGASLRGFGTGETLVLLNGRRLAKRPDLCRPARAHLERRLADGLALGVNRPWRPVRSTAIDPVHRRDGQTVGPSRRRAAPQSLQSRPCSSNARSSPSPAPSAWACTAARRWR